MARAALPRVDAEVFDIDEHHGRPGPTPISIDAERWRESDGVATMRSGTGATALRLRSRVAALRCQVQLTRLAALLNKYDPNQPRDELGRWTSGGENPTSSESDGNRPIRLAGDITGFTKHGINQAINRGVSPKSIHDAVTNPLKVLPQPNGTTRYIGHGAVVVLNPAGEVVTVWGQ